MPRPRARLRRPQIAGDLTGKRKHAPPAVAQVRLGMLTGFLALPVFQAQQNMTTASVQPAVSPQVESYCKSLLSRAGRYRVETPFQRWPKDCAAVMVWVSSSQRICGAREPPLAPRVSEQSRNVLLFGKAEMCDPPGARAGTRPAIPSSQELVTHPSLAPNGSLDGWPRYKTIKLEGMAGNYRPGITSRWGGQKQDISTLPQGAPYAADPAILEQDSGFAPDHAAKYTASEVR